MGGSEHGVAGGCVEGCLIPGGVSGCKRCEGVEVGGLWFWARAIGPALVYL